MKCIGKMALVWSEKERLVNNYDIIRLVRKSTFIWEYYAVSTGNYRRF